MPLPTPGNNVSHYELLKDTSTEIQADVLTQTSLYIKVPYYNYLTNSVYYDAAGGASLSDLNVATPPNDDAALWVSAAAQRNQANPDWDNIADGTSIITTALSAGTNYISDTNIFDAIINILTVGPQIDYWYGSYSLAKFGVFMWGSITQLMPMRFVNTLACQFRLNNRRTANGATIILLPGVTGTITTVRRQPVPQVQWGYDGATWYLWPGGTP